MLVEVRADHQVVGVGSYFLRIVVKIVETFLYGEDFALQTASMVNVLIAILASMLCCLPILPPDQLCQCFQFAKTWNYHL